MITALALTFLLAPQQPGEATQDLVRLSVGTEISGRIVKETADYIEVEIEPGTTVGVAKTRVTSIERAAPAAPAGLPVEIEEGDDEVNSGPYRERDEWHVLHDGDGSPVGFMHATVARSGDGGVRIGEEWRFVEAGRTVETTLLEVVDAAGRPVSAFSHERIRTDDGRLSGDRVVHAIVDGAKLQVQVRMPRGSERQVYDLQPGTRFPLELREELRGRPAGAHARESFEVFDPRFEQFETRVFDVGQTRRVSLGRGDATPVRVLTASSRRGENSEWLDASARPLRREIAGPALVAVRVADEAEARRRAAAAHRAFPPSFRTERDGGFGLWLATPAWSFVDSDRPDEVTARAEVDDATLSLVRLPQLDAELGLASAADSVLRWLRLAHRDLRVGERGSERIRGVDAARIRASAVRHDGEHVELLVHVLRVDGEWFASCGAVPRHAFGRIEPEMVWMVGRFELRREGFAPELRGPLAKRRGSRSR